jgi:decaprenylphospho-beta-D-erythro-pentofuranosid-2-ulose 2-reductase
VIDALGNPQTLLLLGGGSQIGLAIAERYLDRRPVRVILAGRDGPRLDEAAQRLAARGAKVQVERFDARQTRSHQELIERLAAETDIDVAVVAFGLLGDQSTMEEDPAEALPVTEVNYVATVHVGLLLARAMRKAGHGTIVALSSIAGQRPRRANYLYGSTKAGIDAFYRGLSDSLVGTGVHVVVVRPGFVHTRMTEHLPPAPFATGPEAVAAAVVDGVRRHRGVVWVPGKLRLVATVLKLLPAPVLRRLPR